MNTPAHAMINLLLLTRGRDQRKAAAIVAGAIVPDLFIIVFYAWHRFLGTAEGQIWSVEYYSPVWQGWFDGFNSIPILVAAILVFAYSKHEVLLVLFGSMLLHAFADLPLHHDDGHRHFFPFSDWRFESPISYWDPAHYGQWVGMLEMACVLAAAVILYRRWPATRYWVLATLGVYFLYWIYVYLVWM